MEEVFEPLGRFMLRVIKWIIIDAIMEFVLKGTGHVVLKLLTSENIQEQVVMREGPLLLVL
jgi:hypothetical protein